MNKQTQKFSTTAVASQHSLSEFNHYEESDSVKKDVKQCDHKKSNNSIDDSIKLSNLIM